MISFTVEGDPVPKARPRVVKGHTYTPAKTLKAERTIGVAARMAGAKPVTHDMSVHIQFFRANARRCDLDNLVKTVLDGLNRVAFADDDQVVMLTATKLIDRARPRTEVDISGVPDFQPRPLAWDDV